LPVVLDAAIFGKTLSITYMDKGKKAGKRRIKPVSLYAHNGFWYCRAYCYLREGYRVFRCDRIRDAAVDPSAVPEPLDPGEARFRRQGMPRPQESVPLKVSLSPVGVERCEGEHWIAPLLVVDENGGGMIDTVVPRSEISFFADFFIALGNEAEVCEPEELKDAIRSKLLALLARYSPADAKS